MNDVPILFCVYSFLKFLSYGIRLPSLCFHQDLVYGCPNGRIGSLKFIFSILRLRCFHSSMFPRVLLPVPTCLVFCLFVFNFCSTSLENKRRYSGESTLRFVFISFLGFCSNSVHGTLQPTLLTRITRK